MQNKTLTRIDLSEIFTRQFVVPQNKAVFLIEAILDEIFINLNHERMLKISCFGTFIIHQKKQRIGRNPKTGEEAVITARKSLSFRPSQLLRDKINRRMASV